MPGGDGTGPLGSGSGKGRFAGYCAGYPMPGFANPVQGRRRWWKPGYRTPLFYGSRAVGEKRLLEEKAKYFREQLRMLENNLEDVAKYYED